MIFQWSLMTFLTANDQKKFSLIHTVMSYYARTMVSKVIPHLDHMLPHLIFNANFYQCTSMGTLFSHFPRLMDGTRVAKWPWPRPNNSKPVSKKINLAVKVVVSQYIWYICTYSVYIYDYTYIYSTGSGSARNPDTDFDWFIDWKICRHWRVPRSGWDFS